MFGMVGFASASTVLNFPSGVKVYVDKSGTERRPDANNQITLTDNRNLLEYLSAGFTQASTGLVTATSVNKVTITAPATSATLTIADGKTLTSNASMTLAGTDATQLSLAGNLTTAGAYGVTLTATATTALTLPTSGTLSTLCTASHDYGAAAADWTLTAAEAQCSFISVTNASAGVNAILPAAMPGKTWLIANGSGQTLTFKVTGQTGATLASTKAGLYAGTAADLVEIFEQP